MLLSLEVLPAKEGDCLLLHWKDEAGKPRLAVIDGGPGRVYEDTLRQRLEKIREERNVDTLGIDLVMVSHVDTDHIVGIKKLFAELQQSIEDNTPSAFRIRYLWHNTFNDIIGDGSSAHYEKTFTASFTASVAGQPNEKVVTELEKELEAKAEDPFHEAFDIGLILAGHADGRALRDSHAFLFKAHQIGPLNGPFKKDGNATLITAELTPKPLEFHGLDVRVIGPMQAQIDALQKEFDQYIKKHGLTAEAVLAAYADTSVPNLSSLICLVRMGKKTILLTGDARGDYLIGGLKQAGLLKDGRLKVDVLKVPHHGSDRNVDIGFFETVVADTYVFSGNGVHGNPERATLEMLTEARGKNAKYDIILTYPIAATDAERKKDHDKAMKKKKNPKDVVPWDAAKDSLAAFFEGTSTAGYKFKLKEGAPCKVELGDEKISW